MANGVRAPVPGSRGRSWERKLNGTPSRREGPKEVESVRGGQDCLPARGQVIAMAGPTTRNGFPKVPDESVRAKRRAAFIAAIQRASQIAPRAVARPALPAPRSEPQPVAVPPHPRPMRSSLARPTGPEPLPPANWEVLPPLTPEPLPPRKARVEPAEVEYEPPVEATFETRGPAPARDAEPEAAPAPRTFFPSRPGRLLLTRLERGHFMIHLTLRPGGPECA